MSSSSSVATTAIDMGTGDTYVMPPAGVVPQSSQTWLMLGLAALAVVGLVWFLRKRK